MQLEDVRLMTAPLSTCDNLSIQETVFTTWSTECRVFEDVFIKKYLTYCILDLQRRSFKLMRPITVLIYSVSMIVDEAIKNRKHIKTDWNINSELSSHETGSLYLTILLLLTSIIQLFLLRDKFVVTSGPHQSDWMGHSAICKHWSNVYRIICGRNPM